MQSMQKKNNYKIKRKKNKACLYAAINIYNGRLFHNCLLLFLYNVVISVLNFVSAKVIRTICSNLFIFAFFGIVTYIG